MKRLKKAAKAAAAVITLIVFVFVGLLIFVTVKEYRPEKKETVKKSGGDRTVSREKPFTLVSLNTGYAGLGKEEDFFMDGGTKVRPDSKAQVEKNMAGIAGMLKENKADAYFLQEVDLNSKRSYFTDQKKYYENELGLGGMFAYNFKVAYAPYPWPTIGHVESGLTTLTDSKVNNAVRIALPESFAWPLKTCNLKRCLLKTRLPIKGTKSELVLINLHLEAYDSGEGKEAQSKMLLKVLEEEYKKGNYVIAGGDFNQTFQGITKYPIRNKEDWVPGAIGNEILPDGFKFAVDDTYPTCRLLNESYTKGSQVYVIDGFIVSPNVKVEQVKVINHDFQYTDHQPVRLKVRLK
ncbi:endonuclease/exonuclease/phosphatase family protein [Anaerostipes sp.]|uniref:endonuclease/exonuclease/phosphatase family protein n=1 Tax=Anaerostipes sp. TaxID=1872530 RepID=UPI0025BB2C73|nr:endonuclease/exonuclease/phosphatase family protein [Anaerostipes sp.]MBS7008462.1 endonuclease [Anaerostipes sp.]